MRMMNRAASKVVLLVFLLFSSFATCRCMDQSVASKLLDSQIFQFVQLLEQAGLIDEVEGQFRQHKVITILPTIDRYIFSKASPVLLSWLKKDYNSPLLRQVLKNHIILGKFEPNRSSTSVTPLSGVPLKVTENGGVYYIGGVPIRKTNVISLENIVVHTIQGLILSDDINKQFLKFLGTVSKESDSRFSRHQYSKLEFDPQALASVITSDKSVSLGPVSSETPEPKPGPAPPASTLPSVPLIPNLTPALAPTSAPISAPTLAPAPTSAPNLAPTPGPILAPTPAPILAPAPAPPPTLSGEAAWNTVLSSLEEAGNYKNFVSLLNTVANQTLIKETLAGGATILAPSDYAFGVANKTLLDYINATGEMDNVILYHVLLDYVTSSGFLTGAGSIEEGTSKLSFKSFSYKTLYEGTNLAVKVTSNTALLGNNNATISQQDIVSGQGVAVSGLSQILIPSALAATNSLLSPPSAGFMLNFNAALGFGFSFLVALFML